jgi:hypothetical protein
MQEIIFEYLQILPLQVVLRPYVSDNIGIAIFTRPPKRRATTSTLNQSFAPANMDYLSNAWEKTVLNLSRSDLLNQGWMLIMVRS